MDVKPAYWINTDLLETQTAGAGIIIKIAIVYFGLPYNMRANNLARFRVGASTREGILSGIISIRHVAIMFVEPL